MWPRAMLRPQSGYGLDAAWFAFAIINLGAMGWLITSNAPNGIETVPFHFIYVSFTILYGFRTWRSGGVVAGITFVALSTALMTFLAIMAGREDWAELTEVPLMSLMFLAMVFHVRRRQEAMSTAERLAGSLRENLERQRAFVSDASHELLTPITIGRGHVDLLRRQRSWSRSDIEETSAVVLAELDRMQRVIDRLLLLESASAPGFVQPAPTSASELARELLHRWESTADREWVLTAGATGTVLIDRDRVVLAIDALLENAVRHTRDGGRIELSTSGSDGRLILEVADDGNGIPAKAQPHVFDRFYRVDRGRSRHQGGAGLGLSIVRAVVEAHGGTVTVTSAPAAGARFTVVLPGLRSAEQPIAAAANRLDVDDRLELAP
jgi:signal transduction histidine kinase